MLPRHLWAETLLRRPLENLPAPGKTTRAPFSPTEVYPALQPEGRLENRGGGTSW